VTGKRRVGKFAAKNASTESHVAILWSDRSEVACAVACVATVGGSLASARGLPGWGSLGEGCERTEGPVEIGSGAHHLASIISRVGMELKLNR
jgi:hypothetical protein